MLDLVGVAGGPLADAKLWQLEVIESEPLSPNLQRVLLTASDLDGFRYVAGQDLMLRVPQAQERVVNRRYTIRSFDVARSAVTLDVSLHGLGPGTDWVRAARVGDRIDAIGPRGKITLRVDADWHLFVVDETGMPGALAMMEAAPSTFTAMALLEVDTPADEQGLEISQGQRADLHWLHRSGLSAPGDTSLFVEALTDFALPVGRGHAYIAGEARAVRTLQRHLADRGFENDQISAKAYWRRGLPNAEHGEPTREA